MDGGHVLDAAAPVVQVLLEGLQVVGLGLGVEHGVHHVVHDGGGVHPVRVGVGAAPAAFAVPGSHEGGHQGGHVGALRLDGDGVAGQGVLLHLVDIGVDAGGQGQDEGDADDADGAGEGGEHRAAHLGAQVGQRQGQGGEEGHGGLFGGPGLLAGEDGGLLLLAVGVGVPGDLAVLQGNDAGGILLGQLRVVGDHDHQAVLGHLLQQLHHLDGGLGVQRAGGLVGQEDVRIVDQGPGDGHPLHLPARHLGGHLAELVAQAHPLQGLHRPAAAFRLGHARQSQGQLHVGQHRLVGDEVVALEHEADGVVAVGVPVGVLVVLGGAAVDDEVAAGVLVQTAYNVQGGGLAAARGAQDGHKLVFPELQVHPPEGVDGAAAQGVPLGDVG